MRLLQLVWLVVVPALGGCMMTRPLDPAKPPVVCQPSPDAPPQGAQLFLTLRLPDCTNGAQLTDRRSEQLYFAAFENGRLTLHAPAPWLKALKARAGKRPPLIFIHGYNNRNQAALERAVKLSQALSAGMGDYPVVALTWPSYGGFAHYYWDEANAEWSLEGAVTGLAQLTAWFDKSILLAHSMGNRLALPALDALRAKGEIGRIERFIMASPDVDRQWLQRKLNTGTGIGTPVTIYVSLRDQPLSGSWRGHGHARAGDFSWWVSSRDRYYAFARFKDVEVVDTTRVDRTLLGHSAFIDTRRGGEDLCRIVNGIAPRGIVQLPNTPENYGELTKESPRDDCNPG